MDIVESVEDSRDDLVSDCNSLVVKMSTPMSIPYQQTTWFLTFGRPLTPDLDIIAAVSQNLCLLANKGKLASRPLTILERKFLWDGETTHAHARKISRSDSSDTYVIKNKFSKFKFLLVSLANRLYNYFSLMRVGGYMKKFRTSKAKQAFLF
jgi:hypothetical protein